MKKLFKLLSLLRLFRELRGYRSHGRHYGHGRYGRFHHRDHWQPRSRDYHPLYRRGRRPKLKHLVGDLLRHRRY